MMNIQIKGSGYMISATELISSTLRSDLVPVPLTLEFSTISTPKLDNELVAGAEIILAQLGATFKIAKADPVKTQTIKEGRKIGGIACIALLSSCYKLVEPIAKAVILNETSFVSALKSCGAVGSFTDDIPLPKFTTFIGQLPSTRIAKYLQQEAAVLRWKAGKISLAKIDTLLKQTPVASLDPSAVAWINSDTIIKLQTAKYVSMDADGSTVYRSGTATNKVVKQVPGLDSRQIRNLEKVLITRGTMIRPLDWKLQAGEVVLVGKVPYVILTSANQFDTGALGGGSVMVTKIWLATL